MFGNDDDDDDDDYVAFLFIVALVVFIANDRHICSMHDDPNGCRPEQIVYHLILGIQPHITRAFMSDIKVKHRQINNRY